MRPVVVELFGSLHEVQWLCGDNVGKVKEERSEKLKRQVRWNFEWSGRSLWSFL